MANPAFLNIRTEDGIAFLELDNPDEKVNTLGKKLIDEFGTHLDSIESDSSVKAVVLISGKDDNFIAGADIKLFSEFKKPEGLAGFVKKGTDLLDRIQFFKKPVIAAMNGTTMGGGVEVALACHYRIATDYKSTKFALPEVKLGLLPGAGGTQRLPHLVGLPKALDMILTGKNIFPRQAKRMGLVDEITHRHGLIPAAKKAAEKLSAGKPVTRKLSFGDRILTHTPLRNIAFSQARKMVMKQTRGNYPAPFKIMECLKATLTQSRDKGFDTERKHFSELAFTPESKALQALFFAMQAAKKQPVVENVESRDVDRFGVLGAGLMGAGIADVSIQKGYRVVLKDRDTESAVKGDDSIRKDLDKKKSKRIISSFEADQQLSLLHPTGSYDAFKDIPLVIEAVFEDLEIKHKVLKDVEAVSPDCIFASNTSSLPISEISKGAKRPELVLGMHYFSPVQKMPLLEIIKTDKTSPEALATAFKIGVKQGKTVIIVNDGPGFYTTRILAPFMNEAMLLLEEGAKIDDLEKSMKDFGFPVGPMALMDEVGIDVAAHVSDVLSPMFAQRGVEPTTSAKKLYDAGLRGRKNGRGIYLYESGKKGKKGSKKVNPEIYSLIQSKNSRSIGPEEIQERMFYVMLNEAMLCLEENILLNPTDGDLGAILGLGFPPFTGGPFHFTDHKGPANVLKIVVRLQEKHGIRFKPAGILKEKAGSGNNFQKS